MRRVRSTRPDAGPLPRWARVMIGVGQVALLALLAACSHEEEAAPPVRPVLYVEVQPQTQENLGRFAGSIHARYETTLGFRVAGRIARRMLDVGERLEAGTVLASLDPTDQQNALRVRRGDLARSEAQWINAQASARRQQALFDRGVGAKAQLEQAQTELSSARAARDQARSAAQQAEDQLGYSDLRSDFAGVVTAWHAEAGQVVGAGQAVVTVARPEVKEAVFDLPMQLAQRLAPDLVFLVESQLDKDQHTQGTVREIEPQADSATRTRRVRLSLAQTPPGFNLGTSVSVSLHRAIQPLTELPASAVQSIDNEHSQVWVIDADSATVQPRPVRVLAKNAGLVSVDGELRAGERVVSAGVNGLQAGQKVRLDEGVQP